MVQLFELPEEIILHIHLLSSSPFLPLAHPILYHTLHNSPKSYIARYLIRLYSDYGPDDVLVRSARHPICDVTVCKEIKKLWASITCSELPRRIFRLPTKDIHPLLLHLMETYSPSPNSHKGYPLCRAVLTTNAELIDFLLQHDADPGVQASLPVRIATQMGRLDLVKLLVEPKATSPGKKAKLGDRVVVGPELVELAMKNGHEHVVRYFVHDKGIIPPLRSIMKLGKSK